MHHPHDIRAAIAIAPSTMTRMIAIGVSHARMLDCNAVAPVMNGELELCASASPGMAETHVATATGKPRLALPGSERARSNIAPGL
jgi:hypothetical protein